MVGTSGSENQRFSPVTASALRSPDLISGSAAALYLALWNRGSDVRVDGDGAIVDRWRSTQRVRWS